jgi:hypothetical protein
MVGGIKNKAKEKTFYDLITSKQGIMLHSLRTAARKSVKCELNSARVKVRWYRHATESPESCTFCMCVRESH